MTTVTASKTPAPFLNRTNLLMILAVVASFGILALFAAPRPIEHEARGYAYADLITAKKVCPPIVPMADAALADRRLTVREANDLGIRLREMTSAYNDAVTMADAKRRLGLPQPKIPAVCRDTADDDSMVELLANN